jgi:antitoxin (DNA-binding transcriptional repressor) of toxin-antitoxin stability system
MPITANCPGCGKTISAPDAAAGRMARCPHCGGVVEIPSSGSPVAALAALSRSAEATAGAAAEGVRPVEHAPTPRTPGSRNGAPSSTRTSAATRSRMLARTSPYRMVRLLAAIAFGVGATLAVLVFVGGLVALVLVSMSGPPQSGSTYPLIGAAVFVGSLVVALGVFLAAKILSEVLGLWADVGDRVRQMTQMLEDWATRQGDNGM